jgi:hypothetical protein
VVSNLSLKTPLVVEFKDERLLPVAFRLPDKLLIFVCKLAPVVFNLPIIVVPVVLKLVLVVFTLSNNEYISPFKSELTRLTRLIKLFPVACNLLFNTPLILFAY